MNNLSTADINSKIVDIFNDNRDAIEGGSHEIINRYRDSAVASFIRQGVPNRRIENYKYSNLTLLFERYFELGGEQPSIDIANAFKCSVPELDTYSVLTIDGKVESIDSTLPESVIVASLTDAAKDHPEIVEQHLNKISEDSSDPLSALNSMFMSDGLFIYVKPNSVVDKPIQIVNLMSGAHHNAVTQRNLFIVGKSADVKLIVCDHTHGNKRVMLNNLTEIFLKENSSCGFYSTQDQHNGTINFGGLFIDQEKNTNLNTHVTSLHAGFIRNNLKITLNGENCNTVANGVAVLDNQQHVDNFTQIVHAKPNCTSNQTYKNIVDDMAKAVFSGQITVAEGATNTAAFQRNNNILLSDNAKVFTKPQLVIDNDDVKCSHGATVGQIDKEALFYLQARGIGKREGSLMLMFAFAHEVLNQIPVVPLRNSIDKMIDRRLRRVQHHCIDCTIDCTKQ